MTKPTTDKPELSRREMRVQIAKDVLKLMTPRKPTEDRPELFARQQVYFNLTGEIDEDLPLRDSMKEKTCQVCALGALFAAEVWRNGSEVAAANYLDRDELTPSLRKYFTEAEMDKIENWFEADCMNSYGWSNLDAKIVELAGNFCNGSNPGQTRLKAVLQHIIDNNGQLNWTQFLKEHQAK